MSTIITRTSKGSPLSWAEADANLTNLNTDKLEATDLAAYETTAHAASTYAPISTTVTDNDIGITVQAYSANLDEYATVNPTSAGLALLDDVDAAAQRTTLGLGTAATSNAGDFQAADADIPTISASQAEMEAGSETALRSMSPLRVKQAIAALSSGIGIGQTWQDVTASRVTGTTYTNSTGKPISISVWVAGTVGGYYSLEIIINSITTYYNQDYANASGYIIGATIIIPNGAIYSVSGSNTALTKWWELR